MQKIGKEAQAYVVKTQAVRENLIIDIGRRDVVIFFHTSCKP